MRQNRWARAAVGIAAILGSVFAWRRRARRPLRRIALTGNIASGKSAVSDVWRAAGAAIIDADELARAAVAPGTPGLRRVLLEFGDRVRAADGTLNRAALRDIVFSDDVRRRRLEAIVHPEVERLRMEAERKTGARVVVHVIPLLFETGIDDQFDVIVLVDAPEDVRRRRITETRGLSDEDAAAMIRAQRAATTKRARAHHIIDNDGTLAQLRERAREVWSQVGTIA